MDEAEETQFFKFPRTPHMAGSTIVDDDETTTDGQIMNVLKLPNITTVIVQEKVDGANVSIHFQQEWEPIIQKRSASNFFWKFDVFSYFVRSGIVGTGEKPQYNVFRDWVYSNLDTLWAIIGSK